jgi:hypothetical protein
MATPWWLANRLVSTGDNGSGNYEQQQYDSRTGQPVSNVGGQYYSTAPRAQSGYAYDPETYVPGSEGVKVADSGPLQTASFTPGQNAPYGNLGVQAGTVNGKPTYLVPAGDPSVMASRIAGDIGMYGGAQKAQWTSPSGAKGEVVTGPDGNKYIAVPQDAQFSAPTDTANHQTMLQGAWQDFGPIIMAAAGGGAFTGGESLAAAYGGGATGAAAAGATMGGINALGSGGDVAGGILKGGALGGAGYGITNALSGTGLPAPAQSALTKTATGMMAGQSLPQALAGGAIAGINSNNLVPSGSNAPLPTVPDPMGGKMADFSTDTSVTPDPTQLWPTTNDYNIYSPAGTPAGNYLDTGSAFGGDPTASSSSNSAIPDWLSKFFATQGVPGALISGAGSLLAANMTGNAARDAAARSAQASQAATALQAQQYADARARSQPFYDAGVNALAQYQNPELTRPFAMSDFNADPGYGFRMDQGMKALNQSMASKGLGVSGTGIKGAMNFGQNLGSQEYQNAYNRYGQDQATQRNTLANIAGFGPPAAAATTAAGTNYATNAGNMGIGAANTFANADMAAAASQASAYGGIGNALGRAFSPDPMTAAITQMMQKQYGVG